MVELKCNLIAGYCRRQLHAAAELVRDALVGARRKGRINQTLDEGRRTNQLGWRRNARGREETNRPSNGAASSAEKSGPPAWARRRRTPRHWSVPLWTGGRRRLTEENLMIDGGERHRNIFFRRRVVLAAEGTTYRPRLLKVFRPSRILWIFCGLLPIGSWFTDHNDMVIWPW